MLVEFRVKNFRSFRDEQVLSMVASERDESLPGNYVQVGKHKLLKAAAIYGANASGKSNLVRAMRLFSSMVNRGSVEASGPPVVLVPFLLSQNTRKEPSSFEIVFYFEDELYRYGFEITPGVVSNEWLYAYPKGRRQKWFHRRESGEKRDGKRGDFSRYLRGDVQDLLDKTRQDALFLPVAGEFNHPQLSRIWDYLRRKMRAILANEDMARVTQEIMRAAGETVGFNALKRIVERYLQKADLGIDTLEIEKIDPELIKFHASVPEEFQRRQRELWRDEPPAEVMVGHRGQDGERFVLPLGEESDGTRRLFELLGPWFHTVAMGITLMIDELETSLHPLLSRELVSLVLSERTNKSGAQLIFTTHDVTLLDPTLLRRDQIWFTEKGNDGASRLYPLSDYKPRKDESFMRGYMSGRYGAIPIIEAFDEHDA